MVIDELHHHLGRRSSSACAKYVRRLAQDLIYALQLTHLALQLLRALAFRGRQATAEPGIALGLPDPLPERLGRAF